MSIQRPPFWHRSEISTPWLIAAAWQDSGRSQRDPVHPWRHRQRKEGPLWRHRAVCGQGFRAHKSIRVWQLLPV